MLGLTMIGIGVSQIGSSTLRAAENATTSVDIIINRSDDSVELFLKIPAGSLETLFNFPKTRLMDDKGYVAYERMKNGLLKTLSKLC